MAGAAPHKSGRCRDNSRSDNHTQTSRYCIDLTKVNEITIKDRYPLPKISECIDALAGCEYFFLFGNS